MPKPVSTPTDSRERTRLCAPVTGTPPRERAVAARSAGEGAWEPGVGPDPGGVPSVTVVTAFRSSSGAPAGARGAARHHAPPTKKPLGPVADRRGSALTGAQSARWGST